MNIIDLHMHTTASADGTYSVGEMITLAKTAGLKYISLTDHNSVRAYHSTYDVQGIVIIPGIEFDCIFKDHCFHLLGYNIDVTDPRLKEIEDAVNIQHIKHSVNTVQLIRDNLELILNDDELDSLSYNGIITGEMIAEVAINNKENHGNPHLIPYLEGGNRSINPYVNFYWDFFSHGKIGYYHVDYITFEEAIALIHSQGGTAILAHPELNLRQDYHLLDDMIKLGLDGLECHSSYHNADQIAFYMDYAVKNNLLISCGSDFHGKTKPNIAHGEIDISMDLQETLINRLAKHN